MTFGGGTRSRAGALALLALLAGCATRVPQGADWLSGRLSIRVEAAADTPAKSLSSSFELRGDGEHGELRLITPLGTQVAAASWSPGVARLVTSDSDTRYSDLDALARQALGEALPLRALPTWLRGEPWAGADSRATAGGFEQLGWQIGLARYADGWLDVSRSGPPAVSVRARLEKPGG